jgi:putative membrane protein
VNTVLAYWGWHWFFFWPLIPLFWFFLIFLCLRIFFCRGPWRRGWYGYHAAQDPKAILAQRYARGEIDHNEYRERLHNLAQ